MVLNYFSIYNIALSQLLAIQGSMIQSMVPSTIVSHAHFNQVGSVSFAIYHSRRIDLPTLK